MPPEHLLPSITTTTSSSLPPVGHRILHSLSTATTPTALPSILSLILHHKLHTNTTISSTFILTSILRLHSLSTALRLFSLLPSNPHIFVCNSLLRALSPTHPSLLPHLFLQFLHSGISPNNFTYPLLLKSLSSRPHPLSHSLHSRILKSGFSFDTFVQNSLLSFYSSSRDIASCEALFDEMPDKGVVSWSTMIMGYKNCGRSDDALVVFERMQYAGVAPNRVTMVNALATCASHGALEMGVWIHDFIKRKGWVLDVVLGTSLLDMYGKCGRIDDGVSVFLNMDEKNVFTWNSLIGGLALAKSGNEALWWFGKMGEEGVRPDAVTLIGVLRACSHSGMVESGRRIFDSVANGRYGFYPGIKHYGCVVDMLGRAGCLDEAVRCVETMPFEPGVVVWGSLLVGCRAHGEMRLSEVAARRLVELEPGNVVHYVILSNLYAQMGRWRDAEEVRRMIKERGMRKDYGWSFQESSKSEQHAGEAFREENRVMPYDDEFQSWELADVEKASSISGSDDDCAYNYL